LQHHKRTSAAEAEFVAGCYDTAEAVPLQSKWFVAAGVYTLQAHVPKCEGHGAPVFEVAYKLKNLVSTEVHPLFRAHTQPAMLST
jgi:hypothetical protein